MGGYNDTIGAEILHGIGAPVTGGNLRRLAAWAKAEGGSASFNPFNTTLNEPGATAYNSFGPGGKYHVRNYPNAAVGVKATDDTLLFTGGGQHYRELVAVLRNPNSTDAQFAAALGRSHWGTNPKLVAKILHAPGPVVVPGSTAAPANPLAATSGATAQTDCYWHIPFPGAKSDVCLDNVLWVGMIGAGGLIFLVGAAIVAVAAGAKNPAIRQAAETAAIAFPAGKIATGVKAAGAAAQSKTPKGKDAAREDAVFKEQGYDRQKVGSGPRRRDLQRVNRAVNSTSSAGATRPRPTRPAEKGPKRVATREEAGF